MANLFAREPLRKLFSLNKMALETDWKSILEYAGWGAAGLLTILALAALLVLAIKSRRRTSQTRAARALLGAPDETCRESASTVSDLSGREPKEPALARSQKIPCVIRVTFPMFAVACFWLYVWADVSVAAEVHADLKVDGAPQGKWEWSGTMASLTLLPAAKDAWDSGAKTTAILLGFLNGVWPFCQTLVLLTLG